MQDDPRNISFSTPASWAAYLVRGDHQVIVDEVRGLRAVSHDAADAGGGDDDNIGTSVIHPLLDKMWIP